MTRNLLDESFESLWKTYPRKIAKNAAEKAFAARMREGVTLEDLATATINYARSREGQDPQYTLYGGTFYGPNGRWKDYLDPASALPPAPALDPASARSEREGSRRDYGWTPEQRAERDREVAGMFRPDMAVLRPRLSESTIEEGRRWIGILREEHNMTRTPRAPR